MKMDGKKIIGYREAMIITTATKINDRCGQRRYWC